MQSLLILSLCLLAVANARLSFNANIAIEVNFEGEWENWKQSYGKNYDSLVEEELRRAIWMDNVIYIQEFNSDKKNTFRLGVNQFTDYTNKEYQDIFLGYDYEQSLLRRNATVQRADPSVKLPSSVDWREKGAVTPVKNQGQCGSCWSFSATGSLEGQYFLKNGDLKSFSEQQLVDCSKKYGNNGCKGGLMDNAFRYWEVNLDELEFDYPYTAKDGSCHADSSKGVSGDSSYRDVERGSCPDLMDKAANIGPISVAMDASHKSFQHYESGVYEERECSSIKLDHGVLVVGYGTEDGQAYWLVKNSWGERWGEEGYFKIAQEGNLCGICTQASYPVL